MQTYSWVCRERYVRRAAQRWVSWQRKFQFVVHTGGERTAVDWAEGTVANSWSFVPLRSMTHELHGHRVFELTWKAHLKVSNCGQHWRWPSYGVMAMCNTIGICRLHQTVANWDRWPCYKGGQLDRFYYIRISRLFYACCMLRLSPSTLLVPGDCTVMSNRMGTKVPAVPLKLSWRCSTFSLNSGSVSTSDSPKLVARIIAFLFL